MTAPTDPAAPRYIVRYFDESPEIDEEIWGDGWHLVDTTTGDTVWGDTMEPEDAILPRDLSDLVDLLNARSAEAGRLARILAVERGDAEAAPDGWRLTRPGRWSRPYTDDAHACAYLLDTGPSQWGWYVSAPDAGRSHSASAPTALEAMEAADAAREVGDG